MLFFYPLAFAKPFVLETITNGADIQNKNGEIHFETDKVRISDNSKKQNLLGLFNSGIWTIYGVASVLRYLKTGDQFLLWTGLFIGITHFVVFILNLFRSNQSEILFDDIKYIKVKRILSHEFLDIKLKNNRLRRVIGIENSEELEGYVKSHIESVITKQIVVAYIDFALGRLLNLVRVEMVVLTNFLCANPFSLYAILKTTIQKHNFKCKDENSSTIP